MAVKKSATAPGEETNGNSLLSEAASSVEDGFLLTEHDARELQSVLEKLNEAAEETIKSMDRIHLLMQEIVGDLRSARGARSREEPQSVAA